MDSIKAQKIQSMKRYKKQQLVNNLFIYILTTMLSGLFCLSPFWYPPLYSCMNVFLFVFLPQINYFFLSPKFLFIVGNLIVIFLVGESTVFSSMSNLLTTDIFYDDHVNISKSVWSSSSSNKPQEVKKVEGCLEKKEKSRVEDGNLGKVLGEENEEVKEKRKDLDGELDIVPAIEDLNKRADDFIARVNRQRKLELMSLVCGSTDYKEVIRPKSKGQYGKKHNY